MFWPDLTWLQVVITFSSNCCPLFLHFTQVNLKLAGYDSHPTAKAVFIYDICRVTVLGLRLLRSPWAGHAIESICSMWHIRHFCRNFNNIFCWNVVWSIVITHTQGECAFTTLVKRPERRGGSSRTGQKCVLQVNIQAQRNNLAWKGPWLIRRGKNLWDMETALLTDGGGGPGEADSPFPAPTLQHGQKFTASLFHSPTEGI